MPAEGVPDKPLYLARLLPASTKSLHNTKRALMLCPIVSGDSLSLTSSMAVGRSRQRILSGTKNYQRHRATKRKFSLE